MELELHDNLEGNYNKHFKTMAFLANSILGKFNLSDGWKLEIWLDQNDSAKEKPISCGLSLARPKRSTLYVRKRSEKMVTAGKKAFFTMSRLMKNEKNKFAH